jgi:hypothetical protein
MSVPFGGPPPLPFNTAEGGTPGPSADVVRDKVYGDLAKLEPPRKDYQQYYRTREANDNMWKAPQGIHAFLRAYYYVKSADWKQNEPFKLASFTAGELAKMPTYYMMDLDKGMAETVAPEMPSVAETAGCKWLPDAVAGMHPAARAAKPEWFDHLLRKAETKAAKIATQAALSPYACGDATFCRGLRQDAANALH